MSGEEFYTFREYLRSDQEILSPSAEDYLEMIYRLTVDCGYTRTGDLAQSLNVQPPSVTSMVKKLAEIDLIKYEKYGVITLLPKGIEKGKALLIRHNLVENFLNFLNVKEGVLEETEKIEHTLNEEILEGMKQLLDFFEANADVRIKFEEYRKNYISHN